MNEEKAGVSPTLSTDESSDEELTPEQAAVVAARERARAAWARANVQLSLDLSIGS